MEMEIAITGGKKVQVRYKDFVIATDQPVEYGGEGSAPDPYGIFLASLGACAGFYVQAFCQSRGIPTEGVSLVQRTLPGSDGKGLVKIEIEVRLPANFPDKYVKAVVRAADLCAVKKTILNPPPMEVIATRV
jgi:ribosomal protein S12 methylthiotransferase accessory factor